MDSFEFNKIAGAVLFTALMVFGLKELAGVIYHSEAPEKPGMYVEVAEASEGEGASKEEEKQVSIAQLLASANPDNGNVKPCMACHTFEKGGADKVGPHLWGVVGRPIASVEGFSYSSSLQEKSGENWTFEHLNTFLHKPKDFASGTKMAFSGISNDAKRADLIAHLRTLSDDPVPLPEPEQDQAASESTGEQASSESATETASGDGSSQEAAAGAVAMLASVEADENSVKPCKACHTFEKGGKDKIGPHLWGIVGRPIASAEGFKYSNGMQDLSSESWTYENLDHFLAKPKDFVKGTKMAFSGVKNDKKRAELIAYLRSLSDNPEPLPGQ